MMQGRFKDGNDLAAEFILDIRWQSLPAGVQQRARMCLLDDLGAVLSGTLTGISQIAADYAAECHRGEEASILLHGRRATAAGAAFANACAGNGLDIDDDIKFCRGHPGAQLFPAALAVAEEVGASGKALLEALVVGYEIASRTGRCWHDHHQIYHSCGSWGSVACAAVAARLMGLDKERTKHALGIAEYHAPNAPMMRDIDHPSMVKHAVGWGAMNGVMAAELAKRGFTGIPSILGLEAYREWVATLGHDYIMTDGVGIKRWCSCGWGHPALFATLKVVQEHQIRVEEIAHLKVRTFHEGWRLYQGLPTSTEEAQFSIKWPLAALLIDGIVGPDQMLEHRLEDESIRELVGKIEVVEDTEINNIYNSTDGGIDFSEGRFVGRTEITLKDGRSFDSGIVGRRPYDWNKNSLEEKFRWISSFVLKDDQIEKIVTLAWDFEKVADVRELVQVLERDQAGIKVAEIRTTPT